MKKKYSYDLQDRLIAFSVQILNFVEHIPNSYAGDYFKKQLIRSSASPALNYAESQGAVSDKDFVNKVSICLKELRESQVNLKIIKLKPMADIEVVEPALDECSQLVAIFTTIVKNKRDNMK